jgi:hypothetical protein
MSISKSERLLRWVVLFSVIVNLFFNYLSSAGHLNGQTNGEISQQYRNSFTPAGFTFSIWGIIYLSYLIFAVYQLLPAAKNKSVYDDVSIPFIGVNALSVLWLVFFSYEWIGLSLITIIAMGIIGFIQFHIVKREIKAQHAGKGLTIPFSLFFGWISVAVLADFSTWIVAETGQETPALLSKLLICIAALAAIFITLRYRDWIYPLVISWACIGIWSANREFYNQIASLAAGASILLFVWVMVYMLIYFFRSQRQRLEY